MRSFTPGPYKVVPNTTVNPTEFAIASKNGGLRYIAIGIKSLDDACLLAASDLMFKILQQVQETIVPSSMPVGAPGSSARKQWEREREIYSLVRQVLNLVNGDLQEILEYMDKGKV